MLGENNQLEKARYCMIPAMWFWEWQNYGDIKNQWFPWVGWERWRDEWGGAQRIFRVVKLFCLMLVSCLYIFATTQRVGNTKSDSKPWMLADNDDVGSLLSTNVLLYTGYCCRSRWKGRLIYIRSISWLLVTLENWSWRSWCSRLIKIKFRESENKTNKKCQWIWVQDPVV